MRGQRGQQLWLLDRCRASSFEAVAQNVRPSLRHGVQTRSGKHTAVISGSVANSGGFRHEPDLGPGQGRGALCGPRVPGRVWGVYMAAPLPGMRWGGVLQLPWAAPRPKGPELHALPRAHGQVEVEPPTGGRATRSERRRLMSLSPVGKNLYICLAMTQHPFQ
jgi:hypothetical protein